MLLLPDVGPPRMSGSDIARITIVLVLLASLALCVLLALVRRARRKRDGQ